MPHRLSASITPDALRGFLDTEARAIGFTAVGFAPADPLPHTDGLDRWLEASMHGEMSYMARNRELRTNASALHPGAKTVISLITPYRPLVLEDGRATIAAYAHGVDYHPELRAQIHTLLERLEGLLGFSVNGRAIVDSAPFLERTGAARAGLGWIGRSGMLIHPERGTYTLISQLLIDLPLAEESAEPVRDHCGSCRRCIDACPTGAIVGDRVVDGRRCVSYLTIELKGAIPRDLREGVGDNLFGCDICQAVCPWNRFADDVRIAALAPRPELEGFTAVDALRLSRQEFNAQFRGSALERTKRRGLARNAAVVLGNHRRDQDLPFLLEMLREHDEPLVRQHLVWALTRFLDAPEPVRAEIHAALRHAEGVDEDPSVRAEIIWARDAFHF